MASSKIVSVRVAGTSPLSFAVTEGQQLQVKEIGPSSKQRPTIGGKFKTSAYLIYNGIKKIGKLSEASLRKLGEATVPGTCVVEKVDSEKKILMVAFQR